MSDQREVEVPEEAVEQFARWLFNEFGRGVLQGAPSWSRLKPGRQKPWLQHARKALQAAAPVLCAQERERLKATALRLDCDCAARADERLDQHAEECPMGVAHRLIASLDREECDCDPDLHVAGECRERGCREGRQG